MSNALDLENQEIASGFPPGDVNQIIIPNILANNPQAAASNVLNLQVALNKGNRIHITNPGIYYYTGHTDTIVSPSYPAALRIKSNTEFYVAPGVEFRIVSGQIIRALLGNDSFLNNKATVSSWTFGATIGQNPYTPLTFNLAIAKDLRVGDYIIVQGDNNSNANVNGWWKVYAVDVPGAATQVTVLTWKDHVSEPVTDGVVVSKAAADTVTLYKADGNINIDFRGAVNTLGTSGKGASPDWLQPDIGLFMFNKIVDSSISIRTENTDAAKTLVMANWYDVRFPVVNIRNSGAGLTLLSPGRTATIGVLTKSGGEDALLIQNYASQITTNMKSLLDADGTTASGDIQGIEVDTLNIRRPSSSGFTIGAHNDKNDKRLPRRIDGLHIKTLNIEYGQYIGSVGLLRCGATENTGYTAGQGGGNAGIVRIDTLNIKNMTTFSNSDADGLFTIGGENTVQAQRVWDGVSIGSINIIPNDNSVPIEGLRQSLVRIVPGTNLPSGIRVRKVDVEFGNMVYDQSKLNSTQEVVDVGNNCVLDDWNIGCDITNLMPLQGLALSAGGTGYTVGDVLLSNAGTAEVPARVQVATVSAGVVTGVTILDTGRFTSLPTASPIATTGGTGTGCTLATSSLLNSALPTGNIVQIGAGNIRRINIGASRINLHGSSNICPGNTVSTTEINMNGTRIDDLHSICNNLTNNIDVNVFNVDLSNTSNNICLIQSGVTGKTWNIKIGGVKFNSAASPIGSNAVTHSGNILNVRSLGGNDMGTNTAFYQRDHAGVTVNFLGNCGDLRQNFALFTLATLGRNSGAVVNEVGGTAGTPAAIGPGLVSCFTTTWRPLDVTKSANSF